MTKKEEKPFSQRISEAIRLSCESNIGVVSLSFLCQPLSILKPPEPLCLSPERTVGEAVSLLTKHSIGCVLVTDEKGILIGIFTERDCVRKIMSVSGQDLLSTHLVDFMTLDPVATSFESTIAYSLSLMSEGGFRHLPIVDTENKPVGIVSVKDVVDYIAASFINDLLEFDTDTTDPE